MKKAKSIPAKEWFAADTEEKRNALRDKYTVDMTPEEVTELQIAQQPGEPRGPIKSEQATNRLNALNVTRDELLDAILSAMNHAQLTQQIDWPQPMDGILSAWVQAHKGKDGNGEKGD